MSSDDLPVAVDPLDVAEARAGRWLEDLEGVITALVGDDSLEAIAQTVVEQLIPAVGARGGSLFRFDPVGRQLHAIAISGYPPPVVQAYSSVSLDRPSPAAEAINALEPVFVTEREDWARRYPQLVELIDANAVGPVAHFPLIVERRAIGSLGLSFQPHHRINESEWRQLVVIAGIVAQAMGRALAFEEAASATARLTHIDQITDIALTRLSLADLLEDMPSRLAEAVGCEAVRIFLVEDDGRVLRERARHGIGDRPSATVPIGRGLAGTTAQSGRAQVIPDITQHEVIQPAYPDHIRAVAGVPMRSNGVLIGVLDVGAAAGRNFDDHDIELLELAADRVALAIERSRTYELERSARRRSELLERLEALVDVGSPLPTMLEEMAALGVETLAEWCVLTVVAAGHDTLVVPAHRDPALVDIARRLSKGYPFDPSTEGGVAEVVRSGVTQFVPVIDDAVIEAVEDPKLRNRLRDLGLKSSVTVALRGPSAIVGALQLVRTSETFSQSEVALAEDMAGRIGAAVEIRLLLDRHRHTAITLQRSLLPSRLPEVSAAELAARYLPASEADEVGGDFYDVVELGPGRWGILIGDVSGKGVGAAALTGIARQTARAAGRHGVAPIEVLRWIHDAFVTQSAISESYCSAIYGELVAEGDGFRFRFAVGGHPLPVQRSADGSACQVGRTGTVLGLVEPLSIELSEVTLGPGDWLVMYTDGVTDVAVADPITENEFVDLVATVCTGTADEALISIEDVLMTRYGNSPNRDDTAMLIVRCVGGDGRR